MKKQILALLFATSLVVSADDSTSNGNLLQNGDFSDGIAHWYGDVHSVDSGDSVDLSNPNPTNTAGVVVKLRAGEWTKVIQDFDGKEGDYILTISYSLSPDLAFSTKPDDYISVPAKMQFNGLMPFNSKVGDWIVIVNDVGAMRYTYWMVTPILNAQGTQNVRCKVKLKSGDAARKGFYLTFPPGTGVITLHGITLIPDTGTAPAHP